MATILQSSLSTKRFGLMAETAKSTDIDAIAMLDRLDDDYGVDTMKWEPLLLSPWKRGWQSLGTLKGQSSRQRGRQGVTSRRILGNGAAVTGKVFGVERVPVAKGQAMPAYDPRGVMGWG